MVEEKGIHQEVRDASYVAQAAHGGTAMVNVFQQARPRPADPDEVASALEVLGEMPLESVPEPGPLPAGSRMPLDRNPLFVGREKDLKELAAALKGDGTAAIGQIAAAAGLGGIGKTQLACEFVHRYGRYFAGGVFWLNMAEPGAAAAEVAACGGAAGMALQPGFSNLPLEEQVGLVSAAWQNALPRLLVFDNCEEEDVLAQWRPRGGGCRVLVTSRRSRWSATLGVRALRLGALARKESVALLQSYREDVATADARAIAEEVGDLPLALHLAGSFLRAYRHAVAPREYLAQLRDRGLLDHASLQGRGAERSPTEHEQHVARTFALSYDKLDEEDAADEAARKLLARAACFAPGEPIPRSLLLSTLELPGDEVEAQLLAEDGLRRLAALGLVETEAGGALLLHRLVAAFVERAQPDPGARDDVEAALLAEANRLNQAGYPAPLLAWQPHLRAVADAAATREDERAAELCNELGYHLQMLGDYTEARQYYERALAIREEMLGREHPATAASLNNLGFLLNVTGDYEVAQPYYERALAIWEQVLGPEHPDTATSLNNLGALLRAAGDYEGARPYYERALAIREKMLGPEHPDTATTLNNLGFLLRSMGDYTKAQQYYGRALTILEKVLGSEHPDTATSLNNLGSLLQAIGDHDEARSYFERALAIREEVLGPEHPDTAAILNNLGFLLNVMGDYEEARPYYERALAIMEEVLGPEHPNTATTLNNLGALLQETGDYEGARPYFERALAIREKVLGPEHPDTAISLNNLGGLLQTTGDVEVARPYYERALAIFSDRLGPDHPHTHIVRDNLAAVIEEIEEASS